MVILNVLSISKNFHLLEPVSHLLSVTTHCAGMCIKTTNSLSTTDYTGSTLLSHITKMNIFTVTNKAQNTFLDYEVQLDGIAPFYVLDQTIVILKACKINQDFM